MAEYTIFSPNNVYPIYFFLLILLLDISKFLNTRKWGVSKNSHVIIFKTDNEPEIKFFNFGAFQKIMQLLSHDKIIFYMFFGHFMMTLVFFKLSSWEKLAIIGKDNFYPIIILKHSRITPLLLESHSDHLVYK